MGPTLSDSGEDIGIRIATVADTEGITETQAQLDALRANTDALNKSTAAIGSTSKAAADTASSSFTNLASGLKSFGGQMTDVGKSLSTYISLPIIGIAAESVKMAMTFQQSMELLHTNAGVPQAAIASLSKQILDLAPVVGQGPDALATAFYHIATAGQGIWTTAQQIDTLKIAAEGAAIGQADLDDTTYALTSTLAANVIGASNAQQAMGTLLGTVQSGDMHLSDLNAAIGTGLMGTLSSFGVSLQSAGAALADLGDNGEQGAAAANRLRMMLTLMVSPSKEATTQLSALGLTSEEAGTATQSMNTVFAETGLSTTKLADDLRQPNGIGVAVQDLKTHLENAGLSASETDAILSKAFGGGKTDAALLQLLDTTGRLDLKYQQIGEDSGNFATNWQAQQKTVKQQWDGAWSGIQADMVKIGNQIMPDVTKAMKDLSNDLEDVSKWFGKLSPGQKQFVIDALGIAAVMGPVLVIFGTLAKSISSIITLVGTFGKGFGAAINLIQGSARLGVSAVSSVGSAASSVYSTLAGGGTMGAIGVAGAIADIALVAKAVTTVMGAISAMNNSYNAASQAAASQVGAIQEIQAAYNSGKISKSTEVADIAAQNRAPSSYASGTNYAAGGLSLVGENGPEMMYVPRGAQITPSGQTQSMMQQMSNSTSNSSTVTIGQVVLSSSAAVSTFFEQIDRDTQLVGMGMSAARGAY